MFVSPVKNISLPLPSIDSSLIVPKSSVVNSTESIFVIRIVNNKAEWVDIKIGRENNGLIEIYGKLNAGDQLLKAATDEIRNGSILKNIKTVTLEIAGK